MLLLNRHERDPFGRATEKSVREKQKVKEEMTLLRFAYRPHEYQQLICGGFARRSLLTLLTASSRLRVASTACAISSLRL